MKANSKNIILSTTLSRQEKIDLILQGTYTLIIVFFVYLGIILGFTRIINEKFDFLNGKNLFQFFAMYRFNYNLVITLVTLSIGAWITYSRVRRHYNLIILDYTINYLQFIAETNQYHYRIENNARSEMYKVIDSVNQLVASTQHSIEEERKTEQTKDELIANVSHDIRTPLTSTIGYLGALVNEQYNSEDEKNEYIQIAYDKANSMRTLVNDLFLYIESGQASYKADFQDIPIHFFLLQVATEFELEAEEQGVKIIVEVDPEDLKVRMDVDKMVRIFSNFISNALKYGHGDLIRLRSYLSSDQSKIILETCNNGTVLEESEYEQIFERSYRTEKSRTSTIPGSGLGLSIVKNLVKAQNGIVYATVENNETVFRIEFNHFKEETI